MKSSIEEQKVREFLLGEKDFFLRNEDLLCLLKLSHPNTRGSVSLLEKQNKLLRKLLEENRKELCSLKEIAAKNHETLNKIFEWVIKVVSHTSKKKDISSFLRITRESFNLDIVSILLLKDLKGSEELASREKFPGKYSELSRTIRKLKASLITSSNSEIVYWKKFIKKGKFSHARGSGAEYAGMAVLPLSRTNGRYVQGALVLASTEARRFDENLGTYFLNFISEFSSSIVLEK
ncbi:DUF484 family protein [Betaproteobacteria bacterium]|nr:DUF484 family protein [Betaproteobacteria bacterium]